MNLGLVGLYYICSLAGFVMVAGGIWLIYKQKIYIDRETKQVTEIDTLLGKFKTNVPALVLFALGFVPLVYPIYNLTGSVDEVRIIGSVRATSYPVQVYAVLVSDLLNQGGEFLLKVPKLKSFGEDYKILYLAGNSIQEGRASLNQQENGQIKMQTREISLVVSSEYQPQVKSLPSGF